MRLYIPYHEGPSNRATCNCYNYTGTSLSRPLDSAKTPPKGRCAASTAPDLSERKSSHWPGPSSSAHCTACRSGRQNIHQKRSQNLTCAVWLVDQNAPLDPALRLQFYVRITHVVFHTEGYNRQYYTWEYFYPKGHSAIRYKYRLSSLVFKPPFSFLV